MAPGNTGSRTHSATAPSTAEPARPVTVSQVGDLATVRAAGIPERARCIVSFTPPSGEVISAVAIADEEGNLTSYGRLREEGDYRISIADAGGEVLASAEHAATTG